VSALRVLVVATKAPHPPIGGGNVALDALLRALADSGVEVRVVAPSRCEGTSDPAPYSLRPAAAARPWFRLATHVAAGVPIGVARYHLPALADAVEAELAAFDPQVVHVEQAQLTWLVLRLSSRRPLVLRQQNVESRILERLAGTRAGFVASFLRREARRTAAVEARACRAAGTVAAISEPDAAVLRSLAPASRVVVLPAPLPHFTATAAPALRGNPPLLCLGSFDWWPNGDGARWLLREVWPTLRDSLPGAVLHVAGPGSQRLGRTHDDRIERHGVVRDPAALYDPLAVALVPVRAGSGVRLRILEAWMARVPVVTTSVGGEGLVAAGGRRALIADEPHAFAAAAVRLARDPSLRDDLIRGGEAALEGHRSVTVARMAVETYRETIARHRREARPPWAGRVSGRG